MLNITEGFLRRRDKETKQFLRYAIASNGELKACYFIASGREYLAVDETTELAAQNDSISRMLRRWYATLPGNDWDGPRTKDGPGTEDGPGTKY